MTVRGAARLHRAGDTPRAARGHCAAGAATTSGKRRMQTPKEPYNNQTSPTTIKKSPPQQNQRALRGQGLANGERSGRARAAGQGDGEKLKPQVKAMGLGHPRDL